MIRRRVLITFITLLALILAVGAYVMWQLGQTQRYLQTDVPKAIIALNDTSYLDSIAQLIRYDDEVLTQSARNYAFTGDKNWKTRYEEFVPKLEARIKTALEKGDSQDKQYFSEINQSNLALVEMETQALEFVDDNQLEKAQQILDSTEYKTQKDIYKSGLDKYLAKRGLAADQATTVSTEIINKTNVKTEKMIKLGAWTLGFLIVIAIVLLGLLYWIIFYKLLYPLFRLKEASEKISTGDLNQRLEIKSKDEVGELANSFNQMVIDLKESRENIEAKVKERTEELEKLNSFMTGREIKMIELKKKISELEMKSKKE